MLKEMNVNEMERVTGGDGQPQYTDGGLTSSQRAELKKVKKQLERKKRTPEGMLRDGLVEGMSDGSYIDVGFTGPKIG